MPETYRFRVLTKNGAMLTSEPWVVPDPPLPPELEIPNLQAHHLGDAAMQSALVTGAHQELLRNHFGDAYEDLAAAAKAVKQLKQQRIPGAPAAQEAKAQQPAAGNGEKAAAPAVHTKKHGKVYVLPGIMCSLIGVPTGKANHVKWLDPLEVAKGTLLKLNFDAKPLIGTNVASLLAAYLPLKLRLELAGFDVEMFHYDWRFPVKELGKRLEERLAKDKASEVTLVAHSMGGLVARGALKGNGPGAKKVKQVVQLGTPNLGAPTLAQVLRGTYGMLQQVLTLDREHKREDYAKLCATMPGIYALLPPKSTPFGADLREPASWPKQGPQPDANLLKTSGYDQDDLLAPDDRFTLIGGANLPTITAAHADGSNLVYEFTNEGDATVPSKSAAMPGLKNVFWADGVAHDKMGTSLTLANAVVAVLEGKTPELPREYKLSKTGIVQTKTDAQLVIDANPIDTKVADARHLFDAAAQHVAKTAGHVTTSIHDDLKKAASFLLKQHVAAAPPPASDELIPIGSQIAPPKKSDYVADMAAERAWFKRLEEMQIAALQPGDLLFYKLFDDANLIVKGQSIFTGAAKGSKYSIHCMIYMGGGKVLSAEASGVISNDVWPDCIVYRAKDPARAASAAEVARFLVGQKILYSTFHIFEEPVHDRSYGPVAKGRAQKIHRRELPTNVMMCSESATYCFQDNPDDPTIPLDAMRLGPIHVEDYVNSHPERFTFVGRIIKATGGAKSSASEETQAVDAIKAEAKSDVKVAVNEAKQGLKKLGHKLHLP